jgi:hypothetical protein
MAGRGKGENRPEITAYAQELSGLGSNLFRQKKYADAESILRQCLTIVRKTQSDDWTTFDTESLLGGSLLGQEKYGAAEPLLLAGYAGLKQRAAQIPPKSKPRRTEALERLVQLYEATNKPDEAARWNKELEALRKDAGKAARPNDR